MTRSPLITTILPTYKRPHLLRGAIFSALNQSMPDLQVCVYDNASGDETAEVVAEIARTDPRVIYYCHPHLIGAVENFQFGLSRVNTPFFSILADDDLLAPDFYKIALSSLNQFSAAQFFMGSTIDVKEDGKIISANALHWEEMKLYQPPIGLFNLVNNYFNWAGSLFRRNVLEHVKLDLKVKPVDQDFVLRLSAQFPFIVSHQPCALFIHHEKSYSSVCGFKLIWPSWLKIIQNIEAIDSLSLESKRDAKNLMTAKMQKSLFRIAVSLLSKKQFGQAEETVQILLKEFPKHRGAKNLSAILPYIKKNKFLYWQVRSYLALYRTMKSLMIHIKYGDFSKKLISQYRNL